MIYATVFGNLGNPAETKTIASGKIVTNFSVASSSRGKEAGTTWVRCAMWGERGKKVAEYLVKGQKVAVIGALSTREHDGKTYIELDVQELELLGKPGDKPALTTRDDEIPF